MVRWTFDEELKKERYLVKSLLADIDYRNHKLSKLQIGYEETNAHIRQVVNALMDKIHTKDAMFVELEESYKESCASVRCLMNETTMQREQFQQEIGNLERTNLKLRNNMEKQKEKLEQLTKELQELRAKDEIERKTLMDKMERTKRACQRKEFGPLVEELEEGITHADVERRTSMNEIEMNDVECQWKECRQVIKTPVECKSHDDMENKIPTDVIENLSIVAYQPTEDSQTLDLFEYGACSNAEIEELKSDLKEKEDSLQNLESCYNVLIAKECKINQEMQEARTELINGLKNILTNRTAFVIKRMGELDPKAFHKACLLKFPNGDWEDLAAKLCSAWEEKVKDPHWHPFKIEFIRGQAQEIIDDDDEKLKALRDEYGDAAYNSVTNALLELNEYNPSGRYPIPEIWNVKEGRRASLKEIVHYLLKQVKSHKRKRTGCL